MATVGTNVSFRQSISGTGTYALGTAPSAGTYLIQGFLQLPLARDNSGAYSSIICNCKKNGTTLSVNTTAGATGFQTTQTLASGDVITVVLSSSNALDATLNAVTGTCNMTIVV